MTDPTLTIVYVTSMATLQTIGHGCHIYYKQLDYSELEDSDMILSFFV